MSYDLGTLCFTRCGDSLWMPLWWSDLLQAVLWCKIALLSKHFISHFNQLSPVCGFIVALIKFKVKIKIKIPYFASVTQC